MRFSVASVALFAAVAVTAQDPAKPPASELVFGEDNPIIDLTCPSLNLTAPSNPAYPPTVKIGTLFGTLLRHRIGPKNVDMLDAAADLLCISAQQDPKQGLGACPLLLSAVQGFASARTPVNQIKYFGCILNLICIAPAGPKNTGTCNQILGFSVYSYGLNLDLSPRHKGDQALLSFNFRYGEDLIFCSYCVPSVTCPDLLRAS